MLKGARRARSRAIRWRGKDEAEAFLSGRGASADEKERAEHIMLVDLAGTTLPRVQLRLGEGERADGVGALLACDAHRERRHRRARGRARRFRSVPGLSSRRNRLRRAESARDGDHRRAGAEPARFIRRAASASSANNGMELDTCIAIRTIYIQDGRAYFQAGGGVVYDSVPEKEYVESCNKRSRLGGPSSGLNWGCRAPVAKALGDRASVLPCRNRFCLHVRAAAGSARPSFSGHGPSEVLA